MRLVGALSHVCVLSTELEEKEGNSYLYSVPVQKYAHQDLVNSQINMLFVKSVHKQTYKNTNLWF